VPTAGAAIGALPAPSVPSSDDDRAHPDPAGRSPLVTALAPNRLPTRDRANLARQTLAAAADPAADPAASGVRPALSRTIDLDDGAGADDPETTTRRRRLRPRSRRAGLALAAVVVALIALLVAGVFFLPAANVAVVLARQPLADRLIIDIAAPGADPAPDADLTVASSPRAVSVTVAESIPTTGRRREPDAVATGSIRLSNPNREPVTVAAGTVVATEEGIEFSVVEDAAVPAGNAAAGDFGAAVATVRALAPGTGGNVAAGALGGRLPSGVYYANRDGPTAGGTDKTIPTVAPADLDALRARVDAALPDAALAAFAADLPDGLAVLPSTIESVGSAAADETFSHEPGDDADRLTLTAVREVRALAYDRDAALAEGEALLRDRLAAAAPAGFALAPDPLTFADPTPMTEDPDGARQQIAVTAAAVAVLDADERRALADRLAGADPAAAATILREVPEIERFTIDYNPAWLPRRMPANADRLEITISGDSASETDADTGVEGAA